MDLIPSSPVSRSSRIGSMLLDHLIMSFAAVIFFIPQMIVAFSSMFNTEPGKAVDTGFGTLMYVSLIGFAAYFIKDSVNGRSPGKRITGLQVITLSTGEAAGPLRCLARNITLIIWPIEALISLFNTSRRLGDRLAGTAVIKYDASSEKPEINKGQIALALVIAYIPMLWLMQWMPGFESASKTPTGLNQEKSVALQRHLSDSIFRKVQFEVKVYDSVDYKPGRYVWVKGNLKRNYLSDEESADRLVDEINYVVGEEFANESYSGDLHLDYNAAGSRFMRSTTLYGKK